MYKMNTVNALKQNYYFSNVKGAILHTNI
uniref:Uncharacterized protein n=1 Tax=Anguilla anguilla TaxID=7936 RepID=A0A0E9TP78_ANGAN